MSHGIQWVEWHENARDAVWTERLALLRQECPGIQVHHITDHACVGVMQVGKQAEEEVEKKVRDAGAQWRHQAVVQQKLELVRVIGDLATRWKIIPGDGTRLEEILDTAMHEVLRRPEGVQERARIGSKGLKGSQERRWVTVGPDAQLEMEEWLHNLDANTPSVSPFQLKWDQNKLVLSHSGLPWVAEVSNGGTHGRGIGEGLTAAQPAHGTGEPRARGKSSVGGRGQTQMMPPAEATSGPREDKRVRIVTLTVPTLSMVDALLTESQKWDVATLINRQILMDEGP